MKSNSRRAASTALFCLALPLLALPVGACGDEVDRAETAATLDLEADPEADAGPPEVADPAPEEDLPAIEAELSVWPLTLEVFEIVSATFESERLLLVTAAADGVSLVRMEQKKDGPTEVERRLIGPAGTPMALLTIGTTTPRRAALWIQEGHLRALPLGGPLNGTPKTIAAEEGGAFAGPLTAASDDLSALVCLNDGNRPLCLRIDQDLSPIGLHPFERREGQFTRHVASTETGFLVLLARCRNAGPRQGEQPLTGCTRETLEAIALSDEGVLGKPRALPDLESTRSAALVPTPDGLVLVGRRRGAGEHSAWQITPTGTMELDGRFSRVVGGFTLGDTTLLVERGHLKMRQGFPVSNVDLRPLQIERRKTLRHEKKKVERERFPEAIASQLPKEVDQRFSAHDDALVFTSPRRKGLVRAAIVRVSELGR